MTNNLHDLDNFERSYPISELNYKHLNYIRYFLHTMIIFSLFFLEFNVFSIENFKVYCKSCALQRLLHMTKHVIYAGEVDSRNR